jgi:hypothetical protein
MTNEGRREIPNQNILSKKFNTVVGWGRYSRFPSGMTGKRTGNDNGKAMVKANATAKAKAKAKAKCGDSSRRSE